MDGVLPAFKGTAKGTARNWRGAASAIDHQSHATPARRWQPLADAEWDALLPFALVRTGPGRPCATPAAA